MVIPVHSIIFKLNIALHLYTSLLHAFTLVSYSAYFSTLKMEAICSSEIAVDNGLHGVISQKRVHSKNKRPR
jgi:hypothetical protein